MNDLKNIMDKIVEFFSRKVSMDNVEDGGLPAYLIGDHIKNTTRGFKRRR